MKLRVVRCEKLLHLSLMYADLHLPNDRDAIWPPVDPGELNAVGLDAPRSLEGVRGAYEPIANVPLDQLLLESLLRSFPSFVFVLFRVPAAEHIREGATSAWDKLAMIKGERGTIETGVDIVRFPSVGEASRLPVMIASWNRNATARPK